MAIPSSAPQPGLDLAACDREPIHIPGSIQPHGLLLVADPATHRVVAGAGGIEAALAPDWLGRTLDDLLGQDVRALLGDLPDGPGGTIVAQPVAGTTRRFDVAVHRTSAALLAELEPQPDAPLATGTVLGWLETTATAFERTDDLPGLCAHAARAFRALTGFDRVMIYRFLDDEAGRVIAEDRDPALGTFLHHHFPASDIPRQARALYVRNRARVIPAVRYAPAPLRPAGHEQLDLSDVALRSVSPIHLRYLRNMGVEASASISIVVGGELWGLIACHHDTPRLMPRDVRGTAIVLAGGLARQVRAKEEAATFGERLRLRAGEDRVMHVVAGDLPLRETIRQVAGELRDMFDGDGFAFVQDGAVDCDGVCPAADEIASLAAWARDHGRGEPFATRSLGSLRPGATAIAARASGLLAVPLFDEAAMLLWFRAEQIEEIEWAGNPHKAVLLDPAATLTPRTSFETWTQIVHGCARRWSAEEVQAAHRLRRLVRDAQRNRQIRLLNRALERTVAEKDALIAQKDVLHKEVDHRVQNSLQLVAAFLAMQARAAGAGPVADQLAEAQSRLSAVALVHRRLYRDDLIGSVDLSRYLDDLVGDLRTSLGPDWARCMTVELAPVLMPTDAAVHIGLVMTELVINATKYAYDGRPGPLAIRLEQMRGRVRLTVADRGRGKVAAGEGFGSRMMAAMVRSLSGTFERLDNAPGLRMVLTAPLADEGA